MKKLFNLVTVISFLVLGLCFSIPVSAITSTVGVTYQGHVQNIGWQPAVSDGALGGTIGKSLRLEAFRVSLVNAPEGGSIRYEVHAQNVGWMNPVVDGHTAGTEGRALRMEAIKISLVNMTGYSVQYRAHVQNIGWQDWVSDGAIAGTTGLSLRVEAIEVRIISYPTSITLSKTIDKLSVGSTDTLVPTILPNYATNKSVAWASSKSEVATVDSTGHVTAISAGTTTITATTVLGNISATCEVTVYIPVSDISIVGSAKIGSTLTATFSNQTPTVNYQWLSSADGVTYSAVSGATDSSYIIPLGSVNTFYKASATGTGNYSGIVTSSATSAVVKADSIVTVDPQVSDLTYGQVLLNEMLTNASASVAGTFSFNENHGVLDAGIYNLVWTFQPTDTANYNIATGNVSVKVNKKDLTVTAAGIDKVYDGNTTAIVTLSSDMVAEDVLTLSYTSASFSDKNVGVGKAVTAIGIAISGTDAGNYNLVNTTAGTKATITARDLTVTAAGIDKVYDGNTTATVTLSSDMVAEDVLALSYTSASFSDKNVGASKGVTAIGIAISGTDAGNYNLVNTTAGTKATITARDLTVTATGIDKVYDGNTTATVTLSSDMVAEDVLALSYTSASFSDKNVGVGKAVTAIGIAISGTDAGNYNLVNTTAGTTATITPKALTATAVTAGKVYDGTTAAEGDVTLLGIVGSDDVSASGTFTFADKNVGTKTVNVTDIMLSGTDEGNYLLVSTIASTTADITARPISVTADPMTKTYGDIDPTFLYTTSEALRDGDNFTGVLARAAGNNVGNYAINQSNLTAGSNYNITFVSANLTIVQKDLTITAVDNEKYYGDTDPSFAAAYLGFVYDENASNLSGSLSLNRAAGEDAGNYLITPNGLTSSNYHIIFQAGNLTINPRPITILSASASKVYDGTTLTIYKSELDNSGVLMSLRLGDDLVTVTTTGYQKNVGSSANTPSGAVIMRDAVNVTSNYAITYATGTLTVAKRPITITANSSTGIYNGTSKSVSGWTLTGDGTVAASQVLTANAGAAGINTGTYTTFFSNIKIMAGSNEVTTNYDITTIQGTLTINQLPITIIGSSAEKVYDGTILVDHTSRLDANTPMASGDELVTVTTTGSQKNAGSSANTPSGAIIMRGADIVTGNYIITYTPGTLTVTKRFITVTADSLTKTVSQTDPTFTYTLSEPLRNGDSFTGSLSRDAGITVGNYAIKQGTLTAGTNYTITFTPGTLTLIKGTQMLALTAVSSSGGAGTTIALSTSAPGAGAITYSVIGGTSIGASVSSSGVVTLGTAGTVTVTAIKEECTNYYAASNTVTVTSNAVTPTLNAFTASKAGSFDGNNRDLVTFIPTVYNPSGSSYPVTYTYSISKTGEHGSIVYAGGNTARLAVGTYTINCTASNSIGDSNIMTYNLEIPQTSTSVGQAAQGIQTQTVQLIFSGNGTTITSYSYVANTASGHNGGGGDTWSIIGYTGVNLSGASQTLASGNASTGITQSGSIPLSSGIKSIIFTYRVADGHSGSCLSSDVSYSVSSLIPYNDSALVDAVAPTITTALANPTTKIGTAVTLDATATATDGGTVSYKWYRNTTASTTGGTALGVTTATYDPAVDAVGTFYYYSVVTNTNTAATGIKIAAITEVSTVTVTDVNLVDAAAPVITTTSTTPTTRVGIAVTLDATANVTDAGTVTYAWYSNTTASILEGVPLGVTTPEYNPSVSAVGTYYYYCIVTNTNAAATGTKIAKTSGLFTLTVTAPAIVDALALDTLVTTPVKYAVPSTTAINADQYTGTIAWFSADGTTPVDGNFEASTIYAAKVTLIAKAGYTLTGVAANSFTYDTATSVANAANAGIVTIIFPATAAPIEITVFDPIAEVTAGVAGSAYANAAAVIAVLPSSVTANNSTVSVPVLTWVDTDGYNPDVAGSYTFTATLGAIPAGFLNTGAYTATVEVTVDPIFVSGITISSPGNLNTVVNGGTLQMLVDVYPIDATNKSVTWSVATFADGGEATINASTGELTGTSVGNGIGTVRVTATANDGSGKTDTLNIMVKLPSTIEFADGATVTKLTTDASFTNAVSGEGAGAITYSSGTPATATVDAATGEVTIVAEGTTVITTVKAATTTHATVTNTYTLTVAALSSDATLSAGSLGGATLTADFNDWTSAAGGTSIGTSTGLAVSVTTGSNALELTKDNINSVVKYILIVSDGVGTGSQPQPTSDADYTSTYLPGSTNITINSSFDRIWMLVTAQDGTKKYYWIRVTVSN